MSVKRYEPQDFNMYEEKYGDWIKYSDYLKLEEVLEQRIKELESEVSTDSVIHYGPDLEKIKELESRLSKFKDLEKAARFQDTSLGTRGLAHEGLEHFDEEPYNSECNLCQALKALTALKQEEEKQ